MVSVLVTNGAIVAEEYTPLEYGVEMCPYCHSVQVAVKYRHNTPIEKTQNWGNNHCSIECLKCGKWIKWGAKHPNGKPKRIDNNRLWKAMHIEKLGCEMCMACFVRKNVFPSMTFIAHHIIPVDKRYGGKDVFENTILLCNSCHTKIESDRDRIEHILLTMGESLYKEFVD